MTHFSFDPVLIHVCIVKHFSVCVQFISLIEISLCVCIYESVCMCTCTCRSAGIGGKEVTPYILQRVNELTRGRSLQASIPHSMCPSTLHVGHPARMRDVVGSNSAQLQGSSVFVFYENHCLLCVYAFGLHYPSCMYVYCIILHVCMCIDMRTLRLRNVRLIGMCRSGMCNAQESNT